MNLAESTLHSIRPLTPSDQLFLWEMLYLSLFVPEGGTAFERSILDQPEIAMYVKDWGRASDSGFVAIDENEKPLGAIWLRLFSRVERGFGYVDNKTPELGMGVLPEYRGKGIGTCLLQCLIKSADGLFDSISLSVAAQNPAIRLYQKMGFEVVERVGSSITMKRSLLSIRFR